MCSLSMTNYVSETATPSLPPPIQTHLDRTVIVSSRWSVRAISATENHAGLRSTSQKTVTLRYAITSHLRLHEATLHDASQDSAVTWRLPKLWTKLSSSLVIAKNFWLQAPCFAELTKLAVSHSSTPSEPPTLTEIPGDSLHDCQWKCYSFISLSVLTVRKSHSQN